MSESSESEPQKNSGVLEIIMARNDFYRRHYRLVLKVLSVSMLINFCVVVWLLWTRPTVQFKYAYVTPAGQLQQMHLSDRVQFSNETLIKWVSKIAPSLYQFDFLNFRSELNQLSTYFNVDGWPSFQKALKPTLEQIISKKLVTHVVLNGVPIIVETGMFGQVPLWKVQVPIKVMFQKGDKILNTNFLLTLTVQGHIPTPDDLRTFMIVQVISNIQAK